MARGRHSGPRWVWHKDGSRSPPGVFSSGRWRQLLKGKGPDIFIENGRRNPITGQAYRLPVYGWEYIAGDLNPWLNQVPSPPWARSHDKAHYDHRREKYYDFPRLDAVSRVYEDDDAVPKVFRDVFGYPNQIGTGSVLDDLDFEDITEQHDLDFLPYWLEIERDPVVRDQFEDAIDILDNQEDDLLDKRLDEAGDLN